MSLMSKGGTKRARESAGAIARRLFRKWQFLQCASIEKVACSAAPWRRGAASYCDNENCTLTDMFTSTGTPFSIVGVNFH
jgi:hypothetical protein